jgi:hypothetical protein
MREVSNNIYEFTICGFTIAIEDHVWFEDRWMVASLCDE